MNPKKDLTVLYLAAVVVLVLTGVGALTAMKITRTEVDQVFVGQILGLITPPLVMLITLLRGDAKLGKVEEKLDVNTNLTLASGDNIDKVADSVPATPRQPPYYPPRT